MAERPKCKLCHERHWSYESHVFKEEAKGSPPTKARPRPAASPPRARKLPRHEPVTEGAVLSRDRDAEAEPCHEFVTVCAHCGKPLKPRYCGDTCRQAAYRKRRGQP
jgi:hypothetical protein